jgi:tetratricopeptide (TPR) repeat protein
MILRKSGLSDARKETPGKGRFSNYDIIEFRTDANPKIGSLVLNGMAYLSRSDPTKACDEFSKALKIDPLDPNLYYFRATSRMMLNDFQGAILDLDFSIALNNPPKPSYLLTRGAAFAITQSYKEALRDFSMLISLYPDYSQAYFNRGFIYRMQGSYARALHDFEAYERLNPDDKDFSGFLRGYRLSTFSYLLNLSSDWRFN